MNNFFANAASEVSLPVFLQDWWLDAAREAMRKPYREAVVLRNARVAGYLGTTLKKNRIGIRSWEPFDWCRVNEPVLSQSLSKAEKSEVLRELLKQLPTEHSCEFVCGPTARDLPLIAEIAAELGFQQRRETVFWQSPETSRNVLRRVNKKYRNSIKRAAADLEFVRLTPDAFVRLYDANLQAAGRRPYSDPMVAKRLITVALNRRQPQGRILAVMKKQAMEDCPLIDAAIACVWDEARYYYWMTTCSRFSASPAGARAHTHAVKYLLVTAIQDAGERGLIFDTDGGDTPGAVKQFTDLKFENRAERIVFMRHTLPLRLYNQLRPQVKRLATRLAYGTGPSDPQNTREDAE